MSFPLTVRTTSSLCVGWCAAGATAITATGGRGRGARVDRADGAGGDAAGCGVGAD